VNVLLDIPMPIRLACLFIAGTVVGCLINWAVYAMGWEMRPYSPWSSPHPKAQPRHWTDRLPMVGWWGLRRDAALHGSGYWVRPLLVELSAGLLFAGLYWWEVDQRALLSPAFADLQLGVDVQAALHATFAAHLLLVALMLTASLIDADEWIIPDAITVPGTIVGLLLVTWLPFALLPDSYTAFVPPRFPLIDDHAITVPGPQGVLALDMVHVASSTSLWPSELGGWPQRGSLLIALACYLGWCFAILPRPWRMRHGVGRALALCIARMRRERATYGIAVIGSLAISGVWLSGGIHWIGLLTALVGMAASGGLIWAVRLIGSWVLGREAMGFGDVTLMAMIGVFLGWQACIMIFFLAPFAGLAIGLIKWIFQRGDEIPYGPYLCLATLFTIVQWQPIWEWASGHGQPLPGVFALGWLVPAAVGVCLVLMAGMLGLIKAFRPLLIAGISRLMRAFRRS
jgi:prepilin signal peptidase PulO-like enzyme (type II secretory pathway)